MPEASAAGGPATSREERRRPEGQRVVVATIMPGGGPTGVETHIQEVLDYLRSAGQRAELVTARSWAPRLATLMFAPKLLLERIVPAASVAWYRWSHGACLRAALRRHLRDGTDAVVYAQCPVAAMAALHARKTTDQRIVLVVHFHVSQADEWCHHLGLIRADGRMFQHIREFERRVLLKLDGIVYVSESSREALRSRVPGLDSIPSALVPNFIRDRAVPDLRMLGPHADLVTVGSLEPVKNHEFILEVLAEAARLGHRYSLDIIGDGRRRAFLAKKARDLGLVDEVRFLGRRPDARALLPGHRLYVHAASHEVFGLAILEAMAAGLPILAGAVGGIPDLLDHGRAGAFWSIEDPRTAATQLLDLLADPPRMSQLAGSARARYVHKFRADTVAEDLLQFLALGAASGDYAPARDRPNIEHGMVDV